MLPLEPIRTGPERVVTEVTIRGTIGGCFALASLGESNPRGRKWQHESLFFVHERAHSFCCILPIVEPGDMARVGDDVD